jgi:hypothetical protein
MHSRQLNRRTGFPMSTKSNHPHRRHRAPPIIWSSCSSIILSPSPPRPGEGLAGHVAEPVISHRTNRQTTTISRPILRKVLIVISSSFSAPPPRAGGLLGFRFDKARITRQPLLRQAPRTELGDTGVRLATVRLAVVAGWPFAWSIGQLLCHRMRREIRHGYVCHIRHLFRFPARRGGGARRSVT